MNNYKFDIDEWCARLPLKERSYGGFEADIITSPCHVCNNEQLRAEMHDQFNWGPSVATDVFVMADGEPKDRDVTKIGGLPYRPAKAPWPRVKDGKGKLSLEPHRSSLPYDEEAPMTFLGQLNFLDSKDISGDLPGDVLAVFAGQGFCSISLEWHKSGLTDLVSAADMPDDPDPIAPCYGHVCRTVSYPQGAQKAEPDCDPICRDVPVRCAYNLLQYRATQIGSAPFFVQEWLTEVPYRVLCTIGSVHPDQHRRYPWVNREQPLMREGEWSHSRRHLMIMDVGCIYVFIDNNGELLWADSC